MNHTTQSRIIHNTIAQLLDLGFEESISDHYVDQVMYDEYHTIVEKFGYGVDCHLRGERESDLDHDEHLETRNPTFQKTRTKQTHQANISLNTTLPNQDRLARQTKINESQYWKKRRSVARQHQSKNIRSWG